MATVVVKELKRNNLLTGNKTARAAAKNVDEPQIP